MTTVVALATIVHEAIHRQGFRSEATAECLARWLTTKVVLEWTGSGRNAQSAYAKARAFHADMRGEFVVGEARSTAIAARFAIAPLDAAG